jgi:hypothetical protein
MAAAKNAMQKLMDLAAAFVAKEKGEWNHRDWEGFLEQASKLGFEFDDEAKRNLGNALEAAKYFYERMPPAPKKKAAGKKGAAEKKRAAKKTAARESGAKPRPKKM